MEVKFSGVPSSKKDKDLPKQFISKLKKFVKKQEDYIEDEEQHNVVSERKTIAVNFDSTVRLQRSRCN